MISRLKLIVLAAVFQSVSASAAVANAPDTQRSSLFDGKASLGALKPMSMLSPGPGAKPPTRQLNGLLKLAPRASSARNKIYVDEFGIAKAGDAFAVLPPLAIRLTSDGPALIPSERGALSGRHPNWEWIVEPGVLWDEPGEDGWTRAALPVSLRERNANCTHNGIATFRFGEEGKISDLAYQFASETCAYFKADLWGTMATGFERHGLDDAADLIAAYRAEVARRMPVRPIGELGQRYPKADILTFGSAGEVAPDNMTVYGLIADGVHWTGGCQTRAGAHPFCDEIALPSYSLAKSLAGGLGLMRMELLYPGSKASPISGASEHCAGWNDVTLENLLDMATGRYGSYANQADEASPAMVRLFIADSHKDRSRMACNMFKKREEAGRRWVYHSSDSYLLGSALQFAVKRQLAPDADFYQHLVVEPIWSKLGLSPLAKTSLRSYDTQAQPVTGWGLTFLRDDIAKIAQFLHAGGVLDNVPVVDQAMLGAAMQKTLADSGLEAGSANLRYNNGFWAWNAKDVLMCRDDLWIPFMSGYGGIIVALFPNGMTYYYVSDDRSFAWSRAARGAHAIKPMCAAA